jgi:hypothetical protein
LAGGELLLGEVKWSSRPMSARALERAPGELAAKPAPQLPARYADHSRVRVLFVPQVAPGVGVTPGEPFVLTAGELF